MNLFTEIDTTEKKPNTVFEKTLANLNSAQKKAVETTEGPVLVIAGPGTGKTQILAARIGYILKQPDTNPENILCLTYTDAGAIAMRQRLVQFIGPEAYRITIATFHAFCNHIIQENLELFGIHDLELISDLEANQILRDMIDEFPLNHALKRITGDAYYERKRMSNLFSLMKRESWSPEYICEKADLYIESLPEREGYRYKVSSKARGFQKGDVKQAKIDKEQDKMDKLKAAALAFPVYLQSVSNSSRYDFDDMLLWMYEAFNKYPELLLTYQEQYQYILVDEYQDTNGIQNKILQQLISYWDVPNVFVVGDDDQSIFRFQGANVENILQFKETYKDSVEIIVITENYRSSQHILNISKSLIDNNQERLINAIAGLSKDLLAKGENADLPNKPEIRIYPSVDYETVHIAKEIMALKEQGVNLSSIAVIYRKHKQVEDLRRYLEAHDITVNLKRRANVLDTPLINQLITILEYVNAESFRPQSGEHLLFDILHFNIFNINPLVIAHMALDIKQARATNKLTTWREQIKRISNKLNSEIVNQNTDNSYQSIKKLSDDLEYWISESKNITIQQLMDKIVSRGGVLKFIIQSPEKLWLMQDLTTFFDFVKGENAKHPRLTVAQLVETIGKMRDDDIWLSVNKISYAENGVNFVTAHGSKGLEFDYVFLMACTKDAWEKGSNMNGYSMPDNLISNVTPDGDPQEESRRLFYVALTRAKKYLNISYHTSNRKMKEQEKTRFVAEIIDVGKIEPVKIQVSEPDLLDFHMTIMTEEKIPDIALVEEAWMKNALQNYVLSATHLNEYLRCQLSFYFKYVLRIPTAKSEYLSFGTAVHYALEQLFKKMTANNNEFPLVDVVLKDFERSMTREQEAFTDEQFKRRMDYGKEILTNHYNHYVNSWNKSISPEKWFSNILVKGVPINGKVDKLEFEGTRVNVVDYKTGNPKNGKKKLKPQEGDYWRQAVFYRLLIENDPTTNWQFESAEIDFIQPTDDGNFHKARITVGDEEMELVAEQIKQVYSKIMNFEFKEGCGEKFCDWCNFVKSRYQQVPAGED